MQEYRSSTPLALPISAARGFAAQQGHPRQYDASRGVHTNIRERTYRLNLEPITHEITLPASFPTLYGHPASPNEIAKLI